MSSSEILMLGLYLSHEKPSKYKRRTHIKIKLANSTSILHSGHECQCSISKTKSHGKFWIQVGKGNVYSDYHSAIKIVQLIPALRRVSCEFKASLICKVSSSTGSKETLSLEANKQKNTDSKPVTDSEASARRLVVIVLTYTGTLRTFTFRWSLTKFKSKSKARNAIFQMLLLVPKRNI